MTPFSIKMCKTEKREELFCMQSKIHYRNLLFSQIQYMMFIKTGAWTEM